MERVARYKLDAGFHDPDAYARILWQRRDTLDPGMRLAAQARLRKALGISPVHKARRIRKPACAPSPRGSA